MKNLCAIVCRFDLFCLASAQVIDFIVAEVAKSVDALDSKGSAFVKNRQKHFQNANYKHQNRVKQGIVVCHGVPRRLTA